MTWQNTEMTIDELLADPMILVLRKADRVDPKMFETMLRSAAYRLDMAHDAVSDAGEPDSRAERSRMPPAYLCRKMLNGMPTIGPRPAKSSGCIR